MDAYDEGQKAFYDGKEPEDDPYLGYDELKSEDWFKGYLDADAQESGEFEPTDQQSGANND